MGKGALENRVSFTTEDLLGLERRISSVRCYILQQAFVEEGQITRASLQNALVKFCDSASNDGRLSPSLSKSVTYPSDDCFNFLEGRMHDMRKMILLMIQNQASLRPPQHMSIQDAWKTVFQFRVLLRAVLRP